MKPILTLLPLLLLLCADLGAEESAKPPLDISSGTWHLGFQNIFGTGMSKGKPAGKNIDLYPVFEEGRMVNGLATARSFNTSVHIPERMAVTVDAAARTLAGEIDMLVTPDGWVPQDGKSFLITITLAGRFVDGEEGKIGIKGTYTAKRADGQPLVAETFVVESSLIGDVGLTEPGWDDAVWSAGLTLEADAGGLDEDTLHISLGISDGKVTWGSLGLSAQAKWPAFDSIPFDVGSFGPVVGGKVSGKTEITGRYLHPAGEVDKQYILEIDGRRVQGMAGMKCILTPVGEPGKARMAAGRGGCSKGGGEPRNGDAVLWRHQLDPRPWFRPVAGFVAPVPGEHPRLLFRKTDIARLKERAETPEGKAILARLRLILGHDGEAVPTKFNETPPDNHNQTDKKELELGMFTTWHAAGFGFLYQLTGEQKYADLAKQCVELMLAGKNDVDNRYGWMMPGTDLRCGSVLGAMAYAYDFCYEGWPPEFRLRIAQEIAGFDKVTASEQAGYDAAKAAGKPVGDAPGRTSITTLAGRTGYPPGSNHFGSLIGGTGVALLAIRGDEGVDTAWVDARLADIEGNIPRLLDYGFGDGGYYAEGFPPSRLSSEGGLLELVISLRCAAGRDYIDVDRYHLNALTTRWIHHLGGGGKLHYPGRGTYGHPDDTLSQDGVRGSFALGFGAISEQYRRPLLWTWNTFGKTDPDTWGAVTYPHMAVHAFLHWPIGAEPQDPDEVMPRMLVDHRHGYICARNRWQDENDIIVTHLIENGPKGYYAAKDGPGHGRAGRLRVWGLGKKTDFDVGATGSPTHFRAAADGSFVLTAGTALAVDLSTASGADLVVVTVGYQVKPPKGKKGQEPAKDPNDPMRTFTMTIGEQKLAVQVFCLRHGDLPAVTIDGNAIKVGGQTFTYAEKVLVPATFAAAAE